MSDHTRTRQALFVATFLAASISFGPAQAQWLTEEPAQLRGDTPETSVGWTSTPLFTVGDEIEGYLPPGILDGIGAVESGGSVRLFVNHELGADAGYVYTLANGTRLTGARISYFDIDPASREILDSGLAFDTIVDRAGQIVTRASQIHEGNVAEKPETDGLANLCSAVLVGAGQFNLADTIYFAGEEDEDGQEFALDVANRVLYALPWLGRAKWENVSFLDVPDTTRIALLGGDDREGGPLYLYMGQKDTGGDFVGRNGLANGKLYVWVADDGALNPEDFHGTGATRSGTFVEIDIYDAEQAGAEGYDALGFASMDRQDELVDAVGGFRFSRPEDLAIDPDNGTRVVFASTGQGDAYPSDDWGTLYLLDVDTEDLAATVTILYDGDDAGLGMFASPDFGLRSPDNLEWADNGLIYVQEDAATRQAVFGTTSGIEGSVWEIDITTRAMNRISVIDRQAVPSTQFDELPDSVGVWESSGIVDVTSLFDSSPGEVVLALNVQAHSLRGDILGLPNRKRGLVQGGQLLLLSNPQASAVSSERSTELPNEARLDQNAPNPFRYTTRIPYFLDRDAHVRVDVYDVRGTLAGTIVDSHQPAGSHVAVFEASGLAGGVYLYRLIVDGHSSVRRMTLVK